MSSARVLWPRSPLLVYLTARAGMRLALALYGTVAQLRRITELDFGPLELVIVGTALEASVLLLEIPTGVVADVYGRRRSVILGYAIVGLGLLAEGLVTGLAGVLIAQVIWGGGYTLISGARSAWLADEIGEVAAAQVQARAAQISTLAALAGIALAAALFSLGLAIPIQIAGVGLVIGAGALYLCMPETSFEPRARDPRPSLDPLLETFRAGMSQVRRRPMLIRLLGIAVLAGAASESLDRLSELQLIEEVGFPDWPAWPLVWWMASIQVISLVGGLVGLSALRRRVDLGDLTQLPRVLTPLATTLVGAVAVFALAGSFALALAALLCAQIVRQVEAPVYAAWVNRRLDPRSRATVLSMMQQADALGQVGGGPLLGVVGRALGVRAALAGAALLLVPVVTTLLGALRTPEKATSSSGS